MTNLSETPDASDGEASREDGDGAALSAPTHEENEEQNEDQGVGAFALLAVALLFLVGASVYFVGLLLSSDEETQAAADRANAQIESFDSTPVTIGEPPANLPLADDDATNRGGDEDAVATTSAPEVADTDDASQSEQTFDETQAPSPGVDPAEIGIAFVNRTPGDDYGRVGYIDRTGVRQQTELECERLDLNANGGLCLDAANGIGGGGRGLVLDAGLNPVLRFGINLPSRAAASPNGEVVAWTGFSLGHDYLSPGEFATTTQLVEVERGIGANLETVFTAFDIDGEIINDEERNFWGVTFVDSDRFYATVGVGAETSIVEGRVSTSRLQVVHENATCPEVSPDGSLIVVKERREGDFFQLVAIDTATGARRDLPEARTVEDQVEFLDNDTIIYGLPNESEGTEAQPAWDIWSLDLNGGSPQLIVPFADSPAAI